MALLHCGKPEIALRAAEAILDRAIGRPRQAVEMAGDPDRVIVLPATLTPQQWAEKYGGGERQAEGTSDAHDPHR